MCFIFMSSFGRTLKRQSSLSGWPMRRWETLLNLRNFRSAITCVRWDSWAAWKPTQHLPLFSFCWVFFSLAVESAGEDARPWVPLVQNAHGCACVHRRLHRSRHQIPRLLRRSVHSCAHVLHAHVSPCFLLRPDDVVLCFSDSTTARHLHNSGVTAVSQQAWSKITVYSKQGFRWVFTPKHPCLTPNVHMKQTWPFCSAWGVFSHDRPIQWPDIG